MVACKIIQAQRINYACGDNSLHGMSWGRTPLANVTSRSDRGD